MGGHAFGVWLFVLVTSAGYTRSFLFDDGPTECPSSYPCFCQSDEINCEGVQLSTVPTFQQLDLPAGHFAVNLATNSLTSLPSNAFKNLLPSNMTKMDFAIHDNQISSIADDAFNGMSDNAVWVYVDNNELTAIPKAFENMPNLEELSITENPIYTLSTSTSTLAALGQSLKIFSISLDRFSSWPREFQYLKVLEELSIMDLRLSTLSSDAFSVFKDSLKVFDIYTSDFHEIPEAVCDLPNLESLLFTNNEYLADDIFRNCTRNMPSVKFVELTFNHLTRMPNNLFGMFQALNELDLSHNRLSAIEANQIAANSPLTKLNLDYNNFTGIPASLGKLVKLDTLSVTDNSIKSITDNDFIHLSDLVDLNLANNPITSITDMAFQNNVKLQTLDLSGTRLQTLPSSLAGLINLGDLLLDRDPIECSCSAVRHLKAWNMDRVFISGACASYSTLSVQEYFGIEVPKCS